LDLIPNDVFDFQIEDMLEAFKGRFPTTKEFSKYARNSLDDTSLILEDPDQLLINWMEQEEFLFRALEKTIVSERLMEGFVLANGVDIDGFLSFSLSVQNRRKSRVGHAFENHLEVIFKEFSLFYQRGARTENNSKPDFIFPHLEAYKSPQFNPEYLTMLGVKTTCKDRWRQVLSEAKKIDQKHLITLEPAISENQTDEMKSNKLQLVIPKPIQDSYSNNQKGYLWSLKDLILELKSRQEYAIKNGYLIKSLF